MHRDLKPRNIMLDAAERVYVMDFGIALSSEPTGLTQTGALIGTPEYMSPEQAKGETVDARSDLFSLGIILFEMVAGRVPFQADTALGSLWKRTHEPAAPLATLDPTIPGFLSRIVVKCLQIDPARRYQSAREILSDLGERRGPSAAAARTGALTGLKRAVTSRTGVIAAVAAIVLLAAGALLGGRFFVSRPRRQAEASARISLAILPFRNASGDRALDWLGPSLSEMLRTEVGQSSHLRAVPPERILQILQDLRISPDSPLDAATLRRVAEFTSAETLVQGQYVKVGGRVRMDARIEDLKRQRSSSLKAEAPSEKELLGAVAQLASSIQQNLSLSPDLVRELQEKSFGPSSKSLGALKSFNEAVEMSRQGNHLEALKRFAATTQEDPAFAMAFAKLSETYLALGRDGEAQTASKKAVSLADGLPPQERYRILAGHARITNDPDKAIESYENLVKASPDDPQAHFDLAGVYETKGDFDRAKEHYGRVLELDPKYFDALFAAGRVEIKRGSPETSLDFLNGALSLAIQTGNLQGKATILNAIGIAYKNLKKLDEALRYYKESLDLRKQIGDKRGVASSVSEMAQIHGTMGQWDEALSEYAEALKLRRELGDKTGIGNSLNDLGTAYQDLGRYDDALTAYKQSLEIQNELGNEDYQGACLNNIGNIHFLKAEYDLATTYFQQSLQLRKKLGAPVPTAETTNNLGEVDSRVGRYDDALTHYLKALELWREAGDKLGIAIASDGMARLFGAEGRYGAALGAEEEALKACRDSGEKGTWLVEILGGHGNALCLIGRAEEADKSLDEALRLAKELKSGTLAAKTLNFQGDRRLYAGDLPAARRLFEQASQAASRTNDRYLILQCGLNLAKVDVEEGKAQRAIGALRSLGRELASFDLKYLSAQCSIALAQALVKTKDYQGARRELEELIGKKENASLKALLAIGHHLLGTTLDQMGARDGAAPHHAAAARLLGEIREEAKTDAPLKGSGLRQVAEYSSRVP